ncbi:MAG TPA: helix-turn-helix transcriptional regulator [Vicinamibacterales bacterium]|jgi:transcriptional regulator with XRE-family HTH domain|nr:helix-turn-helix transcriptional regulator [Vicinamibacterales bacterium]
MTAQDTFIARLRRHRERNHVTLDEIVSHTRIKREQLEAFERGDLDTWPRGIYARAWIRGYASVVGLDPIDTVDEFCKLFPQGDRRAKGTIRDFAAIIAHPTTYQDEFQHVADEDRRSPQVNVMRGRPTLFEQVMRVMRGLRGPRSTSRAVRSVQHPN